eukprot:1867836-Alexandrium_andersonii.AAC.1
MCKPGKSGQHRGGSPGAGPLDRAVGRQHSGRGWSWWTDVRKRGRVHNWLLGAIVGIDFICPPNFGTTPIPSRLGARRLGPSRL